MSYKPPNSATKDCRHLRKAEAEPLDIVHTNDRYFSLQTVVVYAIDVQNSNNGGFIERKMLPPSSTPEEAREIYDNLVAQQRIISKRRFG